MSKKQEIYKELLRQTLPMTRNVLSSRIVFGRSRKDALELSQLTHNLYVSILEEGFVDHDIWFLNVQARSYCETAKGSSAYLAVIDLIHQLFNEVPENLRYKLEWNGP